MRSLSSGKQIVIISPYLFEHFGGGERYILSVAEFLSQNNQVSLAVENFNQDFEKKLNEYEKYFNLNLSRVKIIPYPKLNFLSRLVWTSKFDILYLLTDGSWFFSLSKKNVLHIQFPFTFKINFFQRLKLINWQTNTNSHFTKGVIEKNWKIKVGAVHQPYTNSDDFKPSAKKNKIILSVGRFFSHLHSKRQDILIRAFSQLKDEHKKTMADWKLVLIGSKDDEVYANKILKLAKDLPVQVVFDANWHTLQGYYSVSKIYWHATGFEVDEYLHPERVEHFGISLLEAMSSKVVPVVINKGGLKEIVNHGVNGFLWNDLKSLKEKTLQLVESAELTNQLADNARERAGEFSKNKFIKQLSQMAGVEYRPLRSANFSVSAVIPSFNGSKLLKKNLKSVFSTLRDSDEVVIVDDHSSDDTVEFLTTRYNLIRKVDQAEFDEIVYEGSFQVGLKSIFVKLICNKSNLRFGASVNKAVVMAKNPYIFLLNNDVSPTVDSLSELISHFMMDRESKIFAVGCLELNKVGKKLIYRGRNELWFERGLFYHSAAKNQNDQTTAWVSGGSGLFDREKWLELNGFKNEYYPGYFEDVDLAFQARKMGYEIKFEPKSRVEHYHETTHSKVFSVAQLEINSLKNTYVFTWLNGDFKQRLFMLLYIPYYLYVYRKKPTIYLSALSKAYQSIMLSK